MLHNSLYRRDLLLAMNKNPHVLRRRDVHRNVSPRPGAKPAAGQVALEGKWSIRTARDLPAERAVAADAEDFLKRLGILIDPSAANQVLLEVGSSDVGFRVSVSPQRIEVHAADA